jgi:hypothetical protein
VSHRRCNLLFPHVRQIIEKGIGQRPPYFRKSVTIEEQEWRPPVAGLEKLDRLLQRQLLRSDFFPVSRNRFVSFSPKARLRSASRAESSVDLGDRYPVPVFEKVGSAL